MSATNRQRVSTFLMMEEINPNGPPVWIDAPTASAIISELREARRRRKILVVIESPFAGATPDEVERNIAYARAAVRDSLMRGESPIASHLLYTQDDILRDDIPSERTLGIEAGLAWLRAANLSAVYQDRGISRGMKQGIERAQEFGIPVTYRNLGRQHERR